MNEKQVIETKHQKLINAMRKTGYNAHMVRLATERVEELQKRGVRGISRFLQLLLERACNKDDYLDILMEGRFCIILARNKFSEIQIEFCKKGPDIKAQWNKNVIYFELMRRRPDRDEWANDDSAEFVLPDKIQNIVSRIQKKIPQLKIGKMNVIVIWSDTIGLNLAEMKEAFTYFQQENARVPERYKDLSGILFTEGGGVEIEHLKQFYLFKNNKASKPIKLRLASKLESLFERDRKIVQKEIEEMTAALKNLKGKNHS